jgi:hypothetical protein
VELFLCLGYLILYVTGLTGIFTKGNTTVYVPPIVYLFPTLLLIIIGVTFSQTESEYISFPGAVLALVAFITNVAGFSLCISGLSACASNSQCVFTDAFALWFALLIFLFLFIFVFFHGLGYMRYVNSIDTNLQYRKMSETQYVQAEEEINS